MTIVTAGVAPPCPGPSHLFLRGGDERRACEAGERSASKFAAAAEPSSAPVATSRSEMADVVFRDDTGVVDDKAFAAGASAAMSSSIGAGAGSAYGAELIFSG